MLPRDRPGWRWDLATASVLVFVLTVLELVLVVTIPPPGSGANIGLPFALLGVLSAGAAVGFGFLARRDSPWSGAAKLVAAAALVFAGCLLLFVGVGVLEEL